MAMHNISSILFLLTVVIQATIALLPLSSDLAISKHCIVRLSDHLTPTDVTQLVQSLSTQLSADSIRYVYSQSINGFTVTLPCTAAEAALSSVEHIQELIPDAKVSISGRHLRKNLGLRERHRSDRHDDAGSQHPHKIAPNVARVGGPRDGSDHTAWVIDTGIHLHHPHLNVDPGRGFTAFAHSVGIDSTLDDGNGHGTHVAGIIGARPFDDGQILSVAPNTRLIPVKVLNSDGHGSISSLLAGIDHVAQHANSTHCVNLSLSTNAAPVLDDAVLRAASKSRAHWTLSAGNNNRDVANYSPGRAKGNSVWTISAIDDADRLAPFSNYGPNVDYSAVGVNVLSTWRDGTKAVLSGTSMAAPAACAVIMITGGNPGTDGVVNVDKDEIPDPIIHF